MRLVILESPYSPANGHPTEKNIAYALAALLDCLERGESPIASHLLYTQILDDQVQWERDMGMDAGHAWYRAAQACVVYTDLGTSSGMKAGIHKARARGIPVEYRTMKDFRWKERENADEPIQQSEAAEELGAGREAPISAAQAQNAKASRSPEGNWFAAAHQEIDAV
ncbi:MAG TPA: hypothetical protein VKQ30_20820 [Ktedonobacterales bacterium]|nr:hypothetical protein [Ktedonobacterales bacterium]